MNKKRPLAIDIFSGCGGLSVGLEAAGFDIVAAIDLDAIHAIVHHFNFPYGVTICQNIAQISSEVLLSAIRKKGFEGEIDLIAGGPPCQGFSLMGNRLLDDPRNRLVFEYLRLIKEIQPKYFIFENVPGMATGNHQQFLHELIQKFKETGYLIVQPIKILDASLYGAPQKRKRLILLGYRADMPQPNYPMETHGDISDQGNKNSNKYSADNLLPLTTVDTALSDLANIPVFTRVDQGLQSNKLDYYGFRESYSLEPKKYFHLCHIRKHNGKVWGHIGSKHTETSIQRFAETTPGTIEKVSRLFRLAPDGLSNTLRAGTASDKGAYTAPRPIHYQQARCISVREAARLHTFPDWFQFHRTIWHGFREIGNAVIPLLAKSLGAEIMKCLEIDISQIETIELDAMNEELLNYNMSQCSDFWEVPHDLIPKRKRTKYSSSL